MANKIAVLGSNGFLGTYACRKLTGSVIPVNRNTVDLTDCRAVEHWLNEIRPDVIVNCANSGSKSTDFSGTDFQNNLKIFLNFYNNSSLFAKFINIGSGAEFDRQFEINSAPELTVLHASPRDSYGSSKNIIARICLESPKFCTLRLFGCFDKTEPSFRLLPRFISDPSLEIADRYFDFFSASDFIRVLEYYITHDPEHKDINCVYQEKILLSEFLNTYCKLYNMRPQFKVASNNADNYTGSGDKLGSMRIILDGLTRGLTDYGTT
jgi:nucleoside-diphosphate-sugar epimerase